MSDVSGSQPAKGRRLQGLQLQLVEPRLQASEGLEEQLWKSYLFECAPIAIVVHDAQGRIFTSNAAATVLLGTWRGDVSGSFFALFPAEDLLILKSHVERALWSQAREELVLRLMTVSGRLLAVQLDTVSLPDGKGTDLLQTALTDVSRYQEMERTLRESEEKHRMLFEHSMDATFLTFRDGQIISANPAACTMLGMTEEEICRAGRTGVVDASDPSLDALLEERARLGRAGTQMSYRAKDGTLVPVEIQTVLLPDGSGRSFVVARDVTQRVETERRLRQTESRYRNLFESMQEAVVLYELVRDDQGAPVDFRILDANHFAAKRLGLVSDDLIGRTVRELFPQTYQNFIEIACEVVLTQEPAFLGEYTSVAGGWLRSHLYSPQRDQVVQIALDITDRKQAELELERSEKRFRMLAGATSEGVAFYEEGKLLFCNDSFSRLFGYTNEQVIGMPAAAFVAPEAREHAVSLSTSGHGEPYQSKGLRRDGSVFPVEFHGATIRGTALRVGLVRDLTRQKQADEALRQSEERFRALLSANSNAIFRMSPNWREMWDLHSGGFLVNTKAINVNWLAEYVHPDDQEHVLAAIDRAKSTMGVLEVEHRVLLLDGSFAWAFSRAVPISDDSGRLLEWFGTSKDITAPKRAEEALRESEERFRKIFEEGPLGALIIGLDFGFVKVNRRFCDMVGYTPEELRSLSFLDLTHPEDLALSQSSPDFLLQAKVGHFTIDKRYRHKTGAIIWVTVTAWLMKDAKGEASYFIGIVEDVTEKKRLQKQLILSAKRDERAKSYKKIHDYQERLCRLASKLSLAQEEERRRIAVEVHDGIGQNLAFCKLKVGQLQQSNPGVKDALGDIIEIIERCIDSSRSLSFELSPAVLFDIGLEPALQWLARLQARRHGLHISVSGGSSALPLPVRILLFQAAREFLANVVKHSLAAKVEITLSETKKSVMISVHDDGIGFSVPASKTLPESASGFGLFNVQEQLRNVGGTLSITSTPGAGTTATASLPHTQRKR